MSCRVMSSRVESSRGAGRNGSKRRAELVSDRVGSGRVSCRLSRRAELGWVKSGWVGLGWVKLGRSGGLFYSVRHEMARCGMAGWGGGEMQKGAVEDGKGSGGGFGRVKERKNG